MRETTAYIYEEGEQVPEWLFVATGDADQELLTFGARCCVVLIGGHFNVLRLGESDLLLYGGERVPLPSIEFVPSR